MLIDYYDTPCTASLIFQTNSSRLSRSLQPPEFLFIFLFYFTKSFGTMDESLKVF